MNSCNWMVGIGLVLFSVCMIGCSDDVQKDAEGDRPGSYTLINGQWYWMDNPNYDPGPRIPPPASLKASLYVQYPALCYNTERLDNLTPLFLQLLSHYVFLLCIQDMCLFVLQGLSYTSFVYL